MEDFTQVNEKFEPEVFCLRCQYMEWDEEAKQCANFDHEQCALSFRRVLAGLEMNCLVV